METEAAAEVRQCQNCWYFCPERGREYGCRHLMGLLSATETDSCERWADKAGEDCGSGVSAPLFYFKRSKHFL